jgi:hypothetical protein
MNPAGTAKIWTLGNRHSRKRPVGRKPLARYGAMESARRERLASGEAHLECKAESARSIYDEATNRRSGTFLPEAIRLPIQIVALHTVIRRRSILIHSKRCRTCATTAATSIRALERMVPFRQQSSMTAKRNRSTRSARARRIDPRPVHHGALGIDSRRVPGLGFLLMFAGLAVVVPVFARSTWHL